MRERLDVVIVGAGVVGCAVAERLAGRGLTVMLLDAAPREGTGLSSRNSGVVHSGLYYPPGSLKARTCIEGQARLYRWCEAQDVAVLRCGKLVIGSGSDGLAALERLAQNAAECDVDGLRLVSWSEALDLEPRLRSSPAEHALWCPNSGIVDAHGLTHSLRKAAGQGGVETAFSARVHSVTRDGTSWRLQTGRGPVEASRLVNAAGLSSAEIAQEVGLTSYGHRLSRGDYFRWHGAPAFQRLIYPIRPKGSAGLGVHVTMEIDGSIRLGPDAKWVEHDEPKGPPESLASEFEGRAAALLGELKQGRLSWDGYGVRPKLFTDAGVAVHDFVVERHHETSWHLLGIESPGLTAALALGALVAEQVLQAKP